MKFKEDYETFGLWHAWFSARAEADADALVLFTETEQKGDDAKLYIHAYMHVPNLNTHSSIKNKIKNYKDQGRCQ